MDTQPHGARTGIPPGAVPILVAQGPPALEDQARAFWLFLRDHGVDAWLDLRPASELVDPARWAADAAGATWVLLLASPVYARHRAPTVEVPPELLHRIVPVVLPGGRAEDLPGWARGLPLPVAEVTEISEDGVGSLLYLLLGGWHAAPPPPRTGAADDEGLDRERAHEIGHQLGFRWEPELAGRTLDDGEPELAPPASPTAREPRHLHATVLDTAGHLRRHAFAPGQKHTVRFSIRPGKAGIVARRPLPEESVVFDQPFGAALDVVVVTAGPAGTTSVHLPLLLPPTGPSSDVPVPVEVAADATEVTATVLVFQHATLLQSAQLRGPVSARDSAPRGRGIRLELDAEITADLAPPAVEVDSSLSFHVGAPGDVLLVDSAGHARTLALGGLDRFRDDVVSTLRIALDRDDVEGAQPGSEQQVALLRDLARAGHTLYRALEPQLDGATIGPHVQLVSAEDEVVPLEFVYDFGLPEANAGLCAHWLDALTTGRCRCRVRTGRVRTVCPLGFWGLRYVIERQVASTTAGRGDPSPGRMRPGHETLPPLDRVLFAASDRVDEVNRGERRRTAEVLSRILGERTVEVRSWRAWHKAVGTHHPSVLLSLPHTDAIGDLVALQIGERSVREVAALTEDYVVAPGTAVGPVVMLLGCSTAVADVPWQSAVAGFRRLGASVVIGTLVETLGRQTAPLARLLAQRMWGADGVRQETIGEVVQALRRSAVAGGATLGMSLVAFGETGWRVPAAG